MKRLLLLIYFIVIANAIILSKLQSSSEDQLNQDKTFDIKTKQQRIKEKLNQMTELIKTFEDFSKLQKDTAKKQKEARGLYQQQVYNPNPYYSYFNNPYSYYGYPIVQNVNVLKHDKVSRKLNNLGGAGAGAAGGAGGAAAGGGGGAGGGGVIPTIINIPVPKITETELEVVHVFPQGTMGYGGYGYPYGGYGSNMIPSYSITSNIEGKEKVDNFWGFNSGIQR